jgi:hypothetical protein
MFYRKSGVKRMCLPAFHSSLIPSIYTFPKGEGRWKAALPLEEPKMEL